MLLLLAIGSVKCILLFQSHTLLLTCGRLLIGQKVKDLELLKDLHSSDLDDMSVIRFLTEPSVQTTFFESSSDSYEWFGYYLVTMFVIQLSKL